MHKSNIYLKNKLSEKELTLLKKDLIDHMVDLAIKIKDIGFSRNQIEAIIIRTVERVISRYKFGKDKDLSDLVKLETIKDLKLEFAMTFPDVISKIIWPNWTEKKTFDKLIDILSKLNSHASNSIDRIIQITDNNLNRRQQKMLQAMQDNLSVSYGELCKQFGTRGIMTYREIDIIYSQLLQALTSLKISV